MSVRVDVDVQHREPGTVPEVRNKELEDEEMKCDHSRVHTPFCPSCGEALEISPATLLRYLRAQQEKSARAVVDYRKHVSDLSHFRAAASVRRKQNTLDKWTRWADWVEQKMGATE